MLREKLVRWAAIAFFATQPLIWITLAGEAGSSIKPNHLAFSLLVLAAFLYWGSTLVSWPRRGWSAVFVGLYTANLAWSWATLAWSGTQAGVGSAIKDTAYFAIFLLMSAIWRKLSSKEKSRAGAWGVLLGVCAFFLVAEITFIQLGRNFIGEYVQAMLSGNVVALQFDFYPKLFNYAGDSTLTAADADYIGTSLRNTLVGAFVLYFFIINAYPIRDQEEQESIGRRYVRHLLAAVCFVLTVLSVSRSNWAALVLGIMAVIASAVCKRSHRLPTAGVGGRNAVYSRLVLFFIAGGAVLIAGVSYLDSSVSLTNVIGDRIGQVADDSRWDMYEHALAKIAMRPFGGYGLAAPIDFDLGPSGTSLEVHNLFLASWYETGLPGFLLSAAFYSALVLAWLRQIVDSGRHSTPDGPSPIWLSGLPALPMVRMLVSGGGGGMTLVEWLAIAVFLSEISRTANRRAVAHRAAGAASLHYEPGTDHARRFSP